jgi:two-component system phosphate regulon response regulator PhoB
VRNGLNGFTVLVADDERYITATISLKLRQAGAKVLIASDGVEAFEIARRDQPDLICSGYRMPLMNGLELAERLKATSETANIPILMLTSRTHRIAPGQLASTNIRALLAKPFSPRELLAKLQDVAFDVGMAA